MKKEIFAIALLMVIFTGSLLNLYGLNKLTGNIIEKVVSAEESINNRRWKEAAEYAEEATKMWSDSDSYTHIVLRHSEINAASDAFYDLLKGIYSENYGYSLGSARMLIDHLTSIAKMEEIRFGTIF